MSREIGIDLGTANVLVHLKGRGIVINEPSVVAVDKQTNAIIAVGKQAYDMIGRVPETIEIIHPLKGGVISDFEMTEAMLSLFLEKIQVKSWFSKPHVLICCPANISEVEQLSLIEAAQRTIGGQIFIESEPKVAMLGAGVDLFDPKARMIIDIGGGTTDIAIIAAGEIVVSESLKIAGDDFDQAIIQYFKQQYHLLIGQRTAQAAKIHLSAALVLSENEIRTYDIKGRDLVTGLPKSLNADSNHIVQAIQPHLEMIARVAKRLLEEAPPEMISDIMETGIILTGGGSMIYQLDNYLAEKVNVTAVRSEQPMNCVVLGTGMLLDLILSGKIDKSDFAQPSYVQRWIRRLRKKLFG